MLLRQKLRTTIEVAAVLGSLGMAQAVLNPWALAPAQAQPAAAQAGQPPMELAEADKAAIAAAAGLFEQELLCKTPIALKVADASTEQVVAQVKALLPKAAVEVRRAGSARFTLDLRATMVGQILQSVAGLAGCKLYVLSDRVLIAPASQLTDAEKAQAKDWAQSSVAAGMGWSAVTGRSVLFQALVPALQKMAAAAAPANTPATGKMNLTFGQLSPDIQGAMQHLVNMSPAPAELTIGQVTPDASVQFDSSDKENMSLTLRLNSLERGKTWYIHPWDLGPKP